MAKSIVNQKPKSLRSAASITFCLSACLIAAAHGCKRKQIQSASAPTAPAQTKPIATSAPSPQRISLTIGNSSITFPPAELELIRTGSGIIAHLDAHAADPDSGNALHFDLVLDDLDDPNDIAGAQWQFRADDSDPERADTLNAISLDGRAVVMEPADVRIVFGRDQHGGTTIDLQGQFQLYDPGDAAKPQKTVAVSGTFTASVH